ncbi:hypothetical protein [Microbacterium sp. SORGH_AS_0888]|uniref:hypothetical protein n=1 Tax=Microbacterium sp. SORGH_AS_0888 TaxID=3041791 RepID=UPI0027828AB7|nr:hypothetical protein [Microbacterium sp. SORGH_AS_0888]MDQ1129964.1 hypothetical protein [Microbacterium sp. SORGH_AS_0888]
MRAPVRRSALAVALAAALALVGTATVTGAAYRDDAYARTAALPAHVEPPFSPGLSTTARMVDTGLGLAASGEVYVWGLTLYDINGAAAGGVQRPPEQVPFPAGTDIRQLGGQIYDVNAVDAGGHVWGWGANNDRNGTDASRGAAGSPQRIRIGTAWNGTGPLLDDILSLATTEQAGAGIRADGTVWNWGGGTGYGGNGTTLGASQVTGLPDPAVAGNRAVFIKGGYSNFFVILESGDVYYIGGAGGSSLPPGTANAGNNAVKLTALNGWMKSNVAAGAPYVVAVDGGISLGAALLSDGTVLSWGGDATRTGRGAPTSPALIPTLSHIVSMQFSFTGAALLDSDDRLWSYGASDDYGQSPQLPALLDTNVVQYSSGQGFTLWQKDDGTFWGRGYNPQGAIGLPTGTQSANRQVLFGGIDSLAVVAK